MVCLFGCYVSCWECRDRLHEWIPPTKRLTDQLQVGVHERETKPTASTSTQPQTHCGSVSEVSKLVDKIITIEPVSWPLAIIKNKGKHAIAREARVGPGGK